MAGGILVAIALVLVVPPLVMFTGAIWSGIFATLSIEDAEHRAEAGPGPS